VDIQTAIEGFMIARAADGFSKSTLEMYGWALRLISEYLGDRPVERITENDIQAFFAWARTDYVPTRRNGNTAPLSGRSLDNIWTAMRSFFNWAVIELHLSSRPDHIIKRPKYVSAEVEPLTQAEIEKLLTACERTGKSKTSRREEFSMHRPTAARDAALILVLLDTGLRVSECARLRISDVDIVSGEVSVMPFGSGQKTKPRHVYLGKSTRKAVWRYLAGRDDPRPDEPLFVTDNDRPLDRFSIGLLLMRLGKRVGINAHPHRFRHTFALEYLRNGGDPFTLQRLLGHTTLDMVNKYIKLAKADLQTSHRRASPVDQWRL
jgi:integrase/recombinase XerD